MAVRRVLSNNLLLFTFSPKYPLDLIRSLTSWERKIQRTIEHELDAIGDGAFNFKVQLCTSVDFAKTTYNEDGTSEERTIDHHFSTVSIPYNKFTYHDDISKLLSTLMERFDVFIQDGSGHYLKTIRSLHLKLFRYKVLRGGGGGGVNKLPTFILNKKACVSVPCTNDNCFFYACLAGVLAKKRNPQRPRLYDRFLSFLNRNGISSPVRLKDIPRFEKQNPNFSISVIGCQGKRFIPMYATQKKTSKYEVTLLLYNEHFYWIKNISRLLRNQTSGKNRYFYCHCCLQSFRNISSLRDHELLCRRELQCLRPGNGDIRFSNFKHLFRLPFVIYFDIESILETEEEDDDDDEKEEERHKPISVCAWTVARHPAFSTSPKVFTGENCILSFLHHLEREEKRIGCILQQTKATMRMDEADHRRYACTEKCDICLKGFRNSHDKCRDHDHLDNESTSNLRFITCSRCNLTYGATQYKIPIIAHNSMKYDISHVICELYDVDPVRILAKNTKRPLSLRWKRNLHFIDSINFLQGSLDSLVDKLPKETLLPYLHSLSKGDEIKEELLLGKAAFPYDYLTDVDKLGDEQLPPIESFYNTLTEKQLSEAGYRKAERIWSVFGCKSLQDYMELYVVLDVLLLGAVFETYRGLTINHFGPDPCHYVSAPSLCMDAMLRMTGVKLEKLQDTDMYLFFTEAIRGGLCGSALRYAKANNELMNKEYDESEPTAHIMSLDANNLYGHSLSNPLPTDDFKGSLKMR